MAISDTINSMKEHVQAAYSQVESMNGTVPTKKNLENLAGAIGTIKTGVDTSDATATADDILLGKTAYANGEKLTGTIEIYAGEGGETVNKLASLVDGSLTEITAEDLAGATKIKERVFDNCRSLISITIPSSVTNIENYALNNCNSLTSATIHDGTTIIGENAFSYCRSLTSISIPSSVTKIGMYAFSQCEGLTRATIPSSVTSIGYAAFSGCVMLNNITIPSSITSIESSTFSNCTSLTSIIIPNSVKSIGNRAFYFCKSLTSINIQEGVTSIGASCFESCKTLTNITIPNSVTNIGSSALYIGSSTNKATITMLPTTPPTIQSSTFNASYLQKIIVPAGTGATYKAATNWSNFADYIEEAAV